MSSYWSNTLDQRISRRRALAATGGVAAGAALLAACGGSSSSSSGGAKGTSLLTPTVDETKSVRRGGVWKSRAPTEPPSFEVHAFVTSAATTTYCYGTMFRINEGYMGPEAGEIVGDNVESWEFSPDKLTLTVKANPNAHFAPIPPVNGRAVTAEDLVASYERVKALSSSRGEYANDLNPDAPIVSMTATDDRTVVIKLKEPNSTILSLLSAAAAGRLMTAPKEARDPNVLDLRKVTAGSGPWYISEYVTGSHFNFKRNPGYKQDKRDVPYIDEIQFPLIPDYSTMLAQFRTGAIYGTSTAGPIKSEDVLPLKRENPNLQMKAIGFQAPVWRQGFGVQPSSPFKDARVRQAWVLNWDRELFLDTLYGVQSYRKEGLPIDIAVEGPMTVNTWKGWYIDPLSKEFGPNSKFFKHDPAEAKKLLAAAGFTSAVPVDVHLPAQGPDFGNFQLFNQIGDILIGMEEANNSFKANRQYWKYTVEFQPKFRDAKGKFDGVEMNQQGPAPTDPINYLAYYYGPGGGFTQGTDQTFADLLNKALKEFDAEKRKEIAWDIQRHDGEMQFFTRIAASTNFDVTWPVLRNRQVYQSFTTGHDYPFIFLDPTKAPIKQA